MRVPPTGWEEGSLGSRFDAVKGLRFHDTNVPIPSARQTATPGWLADQGRRPLPRETGGQSGSLYPANWSRSDFLENFPTDVFGTSSMNTTSSGSHHLATRGRRNSMTSSLVSSWS